MEVNVINALKKEKSKSINEENSLKVEEIILKVKNVDINKSVKDFKDLVYTQLYLSSQISKNRLGIQICFKKGDKEIRAFLSDDYQPLSFYEGTNDPNAIFYLKDIGPQINYRLVYVLEYLGPLLISLLFIIRYMIIFRINNPDRRYQIHIFVYFFMAFFHYTKRILESLHVHIFSRTTMPLKNLFKNCAYYWGIFGILCGYSLFDPYSKDLSFLKIPRYTFVLFFFIAESKNLKTHLLLREIKVKGKGKKNMPPKAEGFQLVTCANYMWEFFAWLSFSIFSLNIFVFFFTVCGFLQMRQWALKKHYEMKNTFGDKYPKNIYAFIPYFI